MIKAPGQAAPGIAAIMGAAVNGAAMDLERRVAFAEKRGPVWQGREPDSNPGLLKKPNRRGLDRIFY